MGLLRRPFIAIAGLPRHPEYRRGRLTKKDLVCPPGPLPHPIARLCAAAERVWPATRPELSVPGHVAIDVRSYACPSAHRPRTLHCLRDHLALRLRWSSVLVA